ncbi:MAG: 4-hydroxythreonine-4-phosphate dehydrogenase PdxA [Gammaproteobacteria bacterium]|nr:4-hydroxythreonine-4-phosphate dehydrogenase PdxA [Gammaproteobacteria bacterium]MDH3434295.1 4-hydroxythreonine-4-phosphate dehydrogenase PdxA [Gammaproteobacteria bacterium]
MPLDKPLIVTAGEPAGIGPELCLALAQQSLPCSVVVLSDPDVLRARAEMVGIDVSVREISANDAGVSRAEHNELLVVPQRFAETPVCGQLNPANASALLDGLRLAVRGCIDGQFAGLVTAPLQKSVVNDAGFAFTGHTEFLAELTNCRLPVMLLVADTLRVALASTHLPLRDVPDFVTKDRLRDVLQVLFTDLRSKFGIDSPEVVVCGLNPHAGEGGYLGTEDADVIAPVVAEFAARGHRIRGPLPADTAFTPAAGKKDAVLAMYHDQGLPVLKYAGFGHAVNVTLGLPIVRTSVDHGTALDLAGSGRADSGSLMQAVRLAATLAER